MNCIVIDDDPVIQSQLRTFCSKCGLISNLGCYSNPAEATNVIRNNNVNLIFLDIKMPQQSGIEFLEEVSDKDFQIIVISGDRKYALQTFQYDVVDYLLKPIEYSRFLKSVNKVIQRVYEKNNLNNSDSIYLKIKNSFIRIFHNDIYFIVISDKGIDIVVKDRSYHINSCRECSNLLTNNGLIQISKTVYINPLKMLTVKDNFVCFFDREHFEDCLVIEEEYKKGLLSKLEGLK
ncbi:MAG: LytTR family DNA-binding domain-containing protein [Bacteroidales bacterium]